MVLKKTTSVCFCALAAFYVLLLSSCGSPSGSNNQTQKQSSITIRTMYGDACITEPLLIDLLTSGAIERLKYVRQYGVTFYARPEINANYNRYEHSVGVLFLLRRYNASLIEQATGLLHDASHTVFSHVGDHFKPAKNPKYSYQDEIHAWYLEQSGIKNILNRYNFELDDVLITNGKNKMVKADKPEVSADNLEYILKAGILTNVLAPKDIESILSELHYDHDRWYFTSAKKAQQFAMISLYNSEHIWGGVVDHLTYKWTADALKRAIELKEINPEDINFSVDTVIWEKLCQSKDKQIQDLVHRIMHHEKYHTPATKEQHTHHIKTKFAGVDPWVKIGDEFKRLTDCSKEYKQEFDRVKKQIADGWYINLHTEPNLAPLPHTHN